MKRALLLAVAIASCGGEPEARTADRARATIAPKPWGAAAALADPRTSVRATFAAPKIRSGKLPNGIRTAYFERHDLPIVSITFAFARGRTDEKPGAVSLLLDMLEFGPKSRKPRFGSYFGWLGARVDTWIDQEVSGITFETLSSHTTSVVLTAGELLLSSSFDSDELDEARRSVVASINTSNTKVDWAATMAAASTLGFTLQSNAQEVAKLEMADLERAYKSLVAPDALIVSAVGDFDPVDMDVLLVKAFEDFKGTARPTARSARVATAETFVLLDRAKSEQSAIVLMTPAPHTGDPDSAAFRLACSVLGSRLSNDTRTAKGYTYGASVGYHGFDSYMKITLDVMRSRTGEAVRDVLGALESVRNAVDASDLEDARSAAARQYTSLFNTNTDAGKTLVRAFAETGTPDVYKRMYDGMHDIKPEQVVAVAQKWMADPHVVVVGDVTAITGDVSSAGLGAPIVRSMP